MNNFICFLRRSITSLDRYPAILLAAWLVLMLSLPLVNLLLGEQSFSQGLTLVVLIQVLLVSRVMMQAWGWWGMLRSAMGVILLVWVIHAIIVRSGLPFGQLGYSELLQPQVFGVPLVVPLTWLMMLPPCWAVARLITRKASGCLVRPLFILASAISFTSWEVYLDPQLVHAGLWDWGISRGFYGVPWQNYVGYFFVAALITFAISPKRLPGGLLVVIYGLSWLVEFFSLLVEGLPVPALAGFILMGGMLIWAAFNSE